MKLILVLAGIALGGLTLLSWTQEWFAVVLENDQRLSVPGQSAAPALSALALASLALSAALAIAGRVVRVVLAVIAFAIGVVIVVSAVSALAMPIAASASVISEATGVAGADSIAGLVASVVAQPWPWLAIVAGVLLAVVGALVIVTSRRWPATRRAYDTGGAGSENAWDALSDGRDPTSR
jgi:predicted metal-binding membrane protein